jgi:hypothetical protein
MSKKRESKHIMQTDSAATIIVGHFSLSLPVIDRANRQKIAKNNIISQLILNGIYRTFYFLKKQNIPSSQAHME